MTEDKDGATAGKDFSGDARLSDAGRMRVTNADQVVEAVRWAVSAEAPVDLIAKGTKRGLGRPVQTSMTLDVSALSGITLYEPEELVMSVRAATPLSEVEAALAERGQELAFEPADYGPLYGHSPGLGTIGGMFAANLSGPRRMKAGAARDHLLGLHAVSGRGELFKTGGRVVKNVTGYDLCKLMTGAFGTLGVMTEATFKVLPRAETIITLAVSGASLAGGVAAMIRVLQSSTEASGAAFVPSTLVGAFHDDLKPDHDKLDASDDGVGSVLIRLEGFKASVADRASSLTALLGPLGEIQRLDDAASRALWRAVRDGAPFAAPQGATDPAALWRVSMPPASAPSVIAAIRRSVKGVRYVLDGGGGVAWIEAPDRDDAGAAAIRAALSGPGGHATLVRGSEQTRSSIAVFQPQPDAMMALSGRVKESFDPHRILNPGRMYPGI